MYLFVVALHIALCGLLVVVILLQPGKGGDLGGGLGGGATAAIFGPQGPTNLLQRATTVVAGLFLVTSITLAWFSSRSQMSNAEVDTELDRLQAERIEKEKAEKEKAAEPAPPEEQAPEEGAAAPPVEGDAPPQ